MKIQKSITALVIFLYIALIYFSPVSYINKPKFLFLHIAKLPLRLTNRIFYNLNNLTHSKHLIQENIALKQTVDILTNQLIQYKETEAENRRLKKLLGFKQKSPFKLIAARVISKDSSNLSDSILIDQGGAQGLMKDTVVITEAGVVGRVSSSSSGMSRIMLITDPNSRISAVVSRTRQLGMVYGTSANFCKLRYLPLDADIKVGDIVMTSGFSDIYPKGLLIGRVVKIMKEPRGLSLSALVKPAADISRTEDVLCIE